MTPGVIIPADSTGQYSSSIAAVFTRTATNKNLPWSPTAPRSHDVTINLLDEEVRDPAELSTTTHTSRRRGGVAGGGEEGGGEKGENKGGDEGKEDKERGVARFSVSFSSEKEAEKP